MWVGECLVLDVDSWNWRWQRRFLLVLAAAMAVIMMSYETLHGTGIYASPSLFNYPNGFILCQSHRFLYVSL